MSIPPFLRPIIACVLRSFVKSTREGYQRCDKEVPDRPKNESHLTTGIRDSGIRLDAGAFVTPYMRSQSGSIGLQFFPTWPQQRKPDRMKFTCPLCGQNAWAKPDAQVLCGACYDEGEGICA